MRHLIQFLLESHETPRLLFCAELGKLKKKSPEMASTAPGARSIEGSGSAGAQSNRRNDSDKPSDAKNKVLPSPTRAHDPGSR